LDWGWKAVEGGEGGLEVGSELGTSV